MDTITDLAASIARHLPKGGMRGTAIERLSLFRADEPTAPLPAVYEASICLIAQGAKRVSWGEQSVVYDAAHYLLVSVDLPLVGHVTKASADAPYLCVKIDIDTAALADLVAASAGDRAEGDRPMLAVYRGDADLTDAASRLVRLLDRPETIPAIAPLIEREILHRLLAGPHGPTLRRMAGADTRLNGIARAIAAIRGGFDRRLRVEEVARTAGMSTSSLHQHFKAVTSLTPLEYQKQLRLQEARRLMMAEGLAAATAAFAVGYESPSQFSREYARLFGDSPRRDVARLTAASTLMAAA